MAMKTGVFLVALLCTANCNPLGQTVCESASILPNMLPSVGTTVCESTPNILANLGLGLGALGLNLPSSLALQLLQQSMVPSLGTTTVCDSKTNVGLPLLSPYGLPLNTGVLPSQTTVCESSTNNLSPLGLPLGLSGLNLSGLAGLPLSRLASLGLPLNGLNLPLPLPVNNVGLPLAGLGSMGLPLNSLAGLMGLGLPIM